MNFFLYKFCFHRIEYDIIHSLKITVAITPSSNFFVISYSGTKVQNVVCNVLSNYINRVVIDLIFLHFCFVCDFYV